MAGYCSLAARACTEWRRRWRYSLVPMSAAHGCFGVGSGGRPSQRNHHRLQPCPMTMALLWAPFPRTLPLYPSPVQ